MVLTYLVSLRIALEQTRNDEEKPSREEVLTPSSKHLTFTGNHNNPSPKTTVLAKPTQFLKASLKMKRATGKIVLFNINKCLLSKGFRTPYVMSLTT